MGTVIDMSREDFDAIRKARLLIVDKEWAATRELRDQLTQMGHEVLGATARPSTRSSWRTSFGPTWC